MPIYEFVCQGMDCGMTNKEVERFCKFEETEAQVCETCKRKLIKVLSNTPGYVKGTETPCKQK